MIVTGTTTTRTTVTVEKAEATAALPRKSLR